jgi:hypothetical protein
MKPTKKDRYERYKLASIPILLCILGYVLLRPSPNTDPTPNTAQPAGKPTTLASNAPVSGPQPAAQRSTSATANPVVAWPEADLAFLSLPSPLANYRTRPSKRTTEKLTAVSTEQQQQQLAAASDSLSTTAQDLANSPVNYLFRSERRQLIMLGDQIFEPGAQLTPTVALHDIQPNTLILKINSTATNSSPATRSTD